MSNTMKTIDEILFKLRTLRNVELNDNRWTQEFVYSLDEAKQAILTLMTNQDNTPLVDDSELDNVVDDIIRNTPQFSGSVNGSTSEVILMTEDDITNIKLAILALMAERERVARINEVKSLLENMRNDPFVAAVSVNHVSSRLVALTPQSPTNKGEE